MKPWAPVVHSTQHQYQLAWTAPAGGGTTARYWCRAPRQVKKEHAAREGPPSTRQPAQYNALIMVRAQNQSKLSVNT